MDDHEQEMARWLDGAMSLDEARAFEAKLEQDPVLAEAAKRWQENDELLRSAFALSPPSQDLLEKMGLGEAGNVVTMPAAAANDNRWVPKRWLPAGSAVAAAIAAAVWLFQPMAAGIHDDPSFQQAMESRASGTQVALRDGGAVVPVLTVRAQDGRYCREFSVTGSNPQSGLACRSEAGWKIEAIVEGTVAMPDGDSIQTAGGTDGSGLNATYEKLGASDPFNAEKENVVLSSGWKK